MSGRGGIYEGPGGEKLHGDGREVDAATPAKASAGAKELVSKFSMPNMGTTCVMHIDTIERLIDSHLEPLLRAANLFGARVKERCPSWFKEQAGSTDFAEARDALAALIEKWKPGR